MGPYNHNRQLFVRVHMIKLYGYLYVSLTLTSYRNPTLTLTVFNPMVRILQESVAESLPIFLMVPDVRAHLSMASVRTCLIRCGTIIISAL